MSWASLKTAHDESDFFHLFMSWASLKTAHDDRTRLSQQIMTCNHSVDVEALVEELVAHQTSAHGEGSSFVSVSPTAKLPDAALLDHADIDLDLRELETLLPRLPTPEPLYCPTPELPSVLPLPLSVAEIRPDASILQAPKSEWVQHLSVLNKTMSATAIKDLKLERKRAVDRVYAERRRKRGKSTAAKKIAEKSNLVAEANSLRAEIEVLRKILHLRSTSSNQNR